MDQHTFIFLSQCTDFISHTGFNSNSAVHCTCKHTNTHTPWCIRVLLCARVLEC